MQFQLCSRLVHFLSNKDHFELEVRVPTFDSLFQVSTSPNFGSLAPPGTSSCCERTGRRRYFAAYQQSRRLSHRGCSAFCNVSAVLDSTSARSHLRRLELTTEGPGLIDGTRERLCSFRSTLNLLRSPFPDREAFSVSRSCNYGLCGSLLLRRS